MPAIDRHFPSYSVAARYVEKDIQDILADPKMLRNERKIRTCIRNVKRFAEVVKKHHSFAAYLGGIASVEDLQTGRKSAADLRSLWKELKGQFLGRITSFHYLMEVGYDLVKPDRVVARIFSRLRLVDGLPSADHPNPQKLTDEQLWQIVEVGRQIAEATQEPIGYVDLVFVVYGQMEGQDLDDLPQGICLDEKPRCNLCGVSASCRYERKTLSAPVSRL
jgi:DNA-3-methyladenine glycosylase I